MFIHILLEATWSQIATRIPLIREVHNMQQQVSLSVHVYAAGVGFLASCWMKLEGFCMFCIYFLCVISPFFVGQACSRWSHDFHHILAWWRKYLWWFLSNLVFIRCFPMITPFFFFPSSMCSSSLSIFFSLTCYKLVETVTAKFSYQESYITYGVYCQVCTNHLSLYNLMQTHRSAMLAY